MGAGEATDLKRTPLFEAHEKLGAKIVPFAGWEMPVQYPTGIKDEHFAVRGKLGVFDVSHMGQVETAGPQATELLQRLLSNDVTKMNVGGAQYSVLCREDGGVLDDLFTYRLAEDRYLTVTNAANHAKDFGWMAYHGSSFDAEVIDRASDYAMLAVQGPTAREIVQSLADSPLPDRFQASKRMIVGAETLVCGTGYTGEDGVELLMAPDDAARVWDKLVNAGAVPAGLAARDTLRLEVCFPLYGNDLMEERGPIEAGLGWCVKKETEFIGSDAIKAVRDEGPAEKLTPFLIEGAGIARQGNPVVGGGEVTSGTMSPCLERGIGMAYLPAGKAAPGTAFEIDVRGRTRSAVTAEKPLYRREQ
jgi:aminomethyltransferase